MIRLLFAAACGLFVLSLPIAKTNAGRALRRAAVVCLALALLPSILCGLFSLPTSPSAPDGASPGEPSFGHQAKSALSCVGFLFLVSGTAYAVLAIRRRFRKLPGDSWKEYLDRRSSGKKIPDEGKSVSNADAEDPVEPWRSGW